VADDAGDADVPEEGGRSGSATGKDAEDPVVAGADGSRDLYGIATWEERSALDRAATGLYWALSTGLRVLVVLLGVVILGAQLYLTGFATLSDDPLVGAFVLLSVVPALALVAYVWYLDPTKREQVTTMIGVFVLAVFFASFAAAFNSLLGPAFQAIPLVGFALFFYLVVGPVEEVVKLLAVRLWAYEQPNFDAVIDGAVYGAVAGLGFATIENALYIGRGYLMALEAGTGILAQTVGTTAVRSLAGPGHVIYSAFAGYYLGLAKFNERHAGPLVVKGLVVAAVIHGTYNTLVTYLPAVVEFTLLTFIAFVVVYDGVFGYLLYRKLAAYREEYEAAADRSRA
jgi:RsiW-degrading membrane proteinase PrsW (M82 family)